MKKRFLAVITTLCMALSLLPVAAFATGSTEIPWYDDSLTELVIDSKEDLLAFAEQVNENGNTFSGKTVKLGADIDLTSAAWTPIGNGTSNGSIYTGNAFKGIFDGNGKTITGLGISSGNCVGLFGIIDGATVKNLTFIGANISGSERAAVAVGLMVGNSTVSSITVDENSTVSGQKYVAGIVGAMTIEGTISDCTNNAKIEGTTYNVGGIVGAAYYTAAGKTMTVSDCTNNGTVTGPYAVGGIVGLSTADVEGCSNTAAITATNMDIGGIVGEQKVAGSVIGCTNSGAVTNTGSGYGTGGIIGWVRYPGYPSTDYGYGEVIEVSGNKNSGVIDGGNDAGGIIGTVYNTASVTGNENSAETIKATEFAAGVVANVQFTETVGGDLPQQKVDLQNNISTTVIDNISANCKHLYAYDNSTASQDGEISDNSGAWVAQVGEEKYATLQAAIDDAQSGDTVTLLENSFGAGAVIDKSITIDFGGYTYSFISGVGSGDLTSNGFQILQESGSVTLKNGTLEVADSAKSSMYILVQNYADLTVTDMTLDGTNLDKWSTHEDQETNGDSYTLSINSGTVTINGKTDIIANDDGSKAYAFDVCDNSGYTGAPSVTVNTTGTITGKIDVSNIGDSTFAISGGTFTVPVERAWCAAGYEPVNLGGGKYGVQVDRPASSGSSSPSYKVEIESMDNGDVSANRTSAKKGSTVTITVTPDAGYELGHLVVLDKNGDSLELTAQENGTYTFKMPASKVTVQAGFALAEDTHDCPSEKFTDVDQSLWYHEGIDYAIQQGLMNGTSSTTFEPGSTTTRGMIVTILHRLEGAPAAAAPSFQDVADGQWYTDAVAWAAANGIVTGYDANTFGPMDPITREQMAAILYRYAAYKGCDVSSLADLSSFTDAGSVSAYAETAMAWAVDAGLITGMTETTLVPQGSATRAQASTILMRYCENVVK